MAHQDTYNLNDGLRRSDLWHINQSPMHFRDMMAHRSDNSSKSLTFGIAAHKYILEKDDFDNEFAVSPKVDKRTKAGKETWAAFEQECSGKELLPLDPVDFAKIKAMAEAIDRDPLARQLLTGQVEQEFYWKDPVTGERLKMKSDVLTEYQGKKYIVDYKTTDSCEDGHFERSCKKYGYQFQAGFYCSGLKESTGEDYGFIFVAQEKKPPYAVRTYICTSTFIENGRQHFRQLLDLYHNCRMTGNWFGYEGEFGAPTPLLDDSERGYGRTPIYTSGFQSDAYSDDLDEDEENL